MSDVVAFDTETYYDSDYSVIEQGQYHYVTDQRFDCYLISVYTKDWHYVGHPKDFDWEKLNGKHLVSHNMAFDRLVFWRMKKLGIVPESIKPSEWTCSMDLSLFLTGHGSLKDAVKELLGIEISKETRDYMKGKRWPEVVAEGKDKDLLKYAYDDAKYCFDIWTQYSPQWPPQERRLSQMTVKQGLHGVLIDQPKLHSYIKIVKTRAIQALEALPWIQDSVEYLSDDTFLQKGDEWNQIGTDKWTVVKKRFKKDMKDAVTPYIGDEVGDYKGLRCRRVTPGKPALSLYALRDKCIEAGLEPPKSFGEKDKECLEFEEKYANKYDFIGNVRLYRKANKLLKKLELIKSRIKPDGRMSYSLRYYGTRTGRWAGMGGFNLQNINKANTHFPEISERSLFIAPPGKTFGVVDLSNIEFRLLMWLVGDVAMLKTMKTTNPYMAHATLTMGYKGNDLKKENPKLYNLSKARCLALGYSAGWAKLITMLPTYGLNEIEIFGHDRSSEDEEAFKEWNNRFEKGRAVVEQFAALPEIQRNIWVHSWKAVTEFRDSNPKIVAFWRDLDEQLKSKKGSNFEVNLPSWRALKYRDVHEIDGESWARLGFKETKFYGGKLAEGLCQALARDVFAECMFRLEDAGFRVVMQIHDEAVVELDNESELSKVLELMSITPPWLPECPLAAEGICTPFYTK